MIQVGRKQLLNLQGANAALDLAQLAGNGIKVFRGEGGREREANKGIPPRRNVS